MIARWSWLWAGGRQGAGEHLCLCPSSIAHRFWRRDAPPHHWSCFTDGILSPTCATGTGPSLALLLLNLLCRSSTAVQQMHSIASPPLYPSPKRAWISHYPVIQPGNFPCSSGQRGDGEKSSLLPRGGNGRGSRWLAAALGTSLLWKFPDG